MKAFYIILLSLVGLGLAGAEESDSHVVDFCKDILFYTPDKSPLDTTNEDGSPGFSWLSCRPDATFITTQIESCPPQYVLSFTNTNLFSFEDLSLLHEVWLKYHSVKTNITESVRTKFGDGYDVRFASGTEASPGMTNGLDSPWKNLKDIKFACIVEQVKNWHLNGLRLENYGGRAGCLMHFSNDELVGDWFDWDPSGKLRFHGRLNHPSPLCIKWVKRSR